MRVADLFPETLIPVVAKPETCVAIMATQMPPAPHIVTFRDTRLACLTVEDEILVAMRPVVDGMGLAWQVQHRKLMADFDRFCVTMMVTQMPGDDQSREHVFIPLENLFGWLMTVHPSKVKPEIRDNVVAYQRECSRVLSRHFLHELHAESTALRALRPVTVRVAELTLEGKTRAEIADLLGKSANSITYHRRSARRLGLLPQLNA